MGWLSKLFSDRLECAGLRAENEKLRAECDKLRAELRELARKRGLSAEFLDRPDPPESEQNDH